MEKSTPEFSLGVTRAELHARQQRLEDLPHEPPAGLTVMQRAHANGMRRLTGMLKNRLRKPETAEDTIQTGLVLYLREWLNIYKQGVAETHISTVDRTILDIRRDTVMQILTEITRTAGKPAGLPSSPHGSGSAGDRPTDGVPPADF